MTKVKHLKLVMPEDLHAQWKARAALEKKPIPILVVEVLAEEIKRKPK